MKIGKFCNTLNPLPGNFCEPAFGKYLSSRKCPAKNDGVFAERPLEIFILFYFLKKG